ncbi:MAG: hypothetical protein K2M34_01855 [Alphaproteobacteria bacterium]|nr:hypothetical protein [Alphaproteobacteria bacterium]
MKRAHIFSNIRRKLAKITKLQAIIFTSFSLIALAVLLWIFIPHNNSKIMRVTLDAPTPVSMHFTDDASAAFLSSDNVPDINNNRQISSIDTLDIYYRWESGPYDDVFKPNLTDAEIAKNIKITPAVRGTWQMLGRDALRFIPEIDWAANTKFTVKIKRALFNDDVSPNTRTVSFKTADISATIDSFNIYPDPESKKSVLGIAVISFNYPIDVTNFSDKVSMRLDDRNIEFTVKFDKFHRTAFITSQPITVTDDAQTLRLKLNRINAWGVNTATKKITAKTTIDAADNFFKITDLTTTIADDTDGNSQQLILLNTTIAAQNNTKWSDYITAYLLPKTGPDSASTDGASYHWALDAVTPSVIAKAQQIKLTPIKFATAAGVNQYAFSYVVSDSDARYIYVSVKPGLKASGDYVAHNGIDKVLRVPYPQKSVTIAGSGAILSLSGDKKLGIMSRGGADSAHAILYKIKSSEINHLISQTYNLFSQNLEFKSWSFGKYDMAVVFQKNIAFLNPSPIRANYASLDLNEYLTRGSTDKTGIFIVQVGANKNNAENGDQRLVLLTDMAIIRKTNSDDTSSLFVSNITDGTPAIDVEISVLGRNGNPIWAGRTDDMGHADIPRFAWSEYKNARQPVAIVARRGDDVSFIPYNPEYALQVDYSKFNIDGEYANAGTALNAYVFSDRGIYRPGETAIIAAIVKNRNFKSLAGIPVRLEAHDPRGREVLNRTVSLDNDGMFDVTYAVPANSATGTYTVYLYSLNSKNKNQDMLGMTSFQVAEFTPDNMKITAKINNSNNVDDNGGWIQTDQISANVYLQNLFGTPAVGRRISATATLRPIEFTFNQYKAYTFAMHGTSNGGISNSAAIRTQTYTSDIPDVKTDDTGHANLDVKFNSAIPFGTYMLTLNIHGYEAGSGKSVQTSISSRVSDTPFVIGYKSDTDLSYINRNANANLDLIAVAPDATQTDAENLTMELIQRENLTSLIKDGNGYYKYQTITRDNIVSAEKINIAKSGTTIPLNTNNGGTYFIQIKNDADQTLASIEYFVASSGNMSLESDTNAEIKIKLDKSTYRPGDDININITAPYAGYGLITIERDKVYAYKWFKSNTASFVQHITVPQGFEGTGYINVSFVRDRTSHDIFTNPYSYAVAPFSADISAHEINVKLSAPEKIDSNKLTIEYTTNQNAKLMIFAVNTGILQVAKYKIPNPIAHFFKKSALQVETFQTLSLLLPEYKILREFAQTGGGDYDEMDGGAGMALINPFARRISAPVAFYSGIINATANQTGSVTVDFPEEFTGAATIFAVATNATAMGAANTITRVQAPIILTTTMPTFAAPGDTFRANIAVSNQTPDSGDDAIIDLTAKTMGSISIIGAHDATIKIPENTEALSGFDIVAGNMPAASELSVRADMENPANNNIITRKSINTISVRPVTTFQTKITSDEIKSDAMTVKNFAIPMYQGAGGMKLYISRNSTAAIRPLFEYLATYQFTCTEQLTSRAMPYALMPTNKFIGTSFDTSSKIIADTVNTLRNRQNDDGSFDLWSGDARSINNMSNADTAYITAYVTQFLTIAKTHGFTIPKDMLSRAVDYLRTFAGAPISDAGHATATAYAIYVATLNGYITTSYINSFEEYANANIPQWREQLMGAYIAASYKLLKQSDKASNLIAKYNPSKSTKFVWHTMFNNNVANDAMYAYLMKTHFNTTPGGMSDVVREYINSGDYSAYTSAVVIMGLAGATGTNTAPDVNSIAVSANGAPLRAKIVSGNYIADIPADASKITIKCKKCSRNNRLTYAIVQQGYPIKTTPATNGIDITREYYDASNRRITSANVGDIVTVKIFARTRGASEYVQNVAITDLLPGGFIPDAESMTGNAEFSQFREDRVVIYTALSRTAQEFTYKAQISTAGTFAIPPIHAESMYNPQINATGSVGSFKVVNAVNE